LNEKVEYERLPSDGFGNIRLKDPVEELASVEAASAAGGGKLGLVESAGNKLGLVEAAEGKIDLGCREGLTSISSSVRSFGVSPGFLFFKLSPQNIFQEPLKFISLSSIIW